MRRITKHLPGGEGIGVVTDLRDEARYSPEAMPATYQDRWGLEAVFHQTAAVFSWRNLTGTQPKPVLFQLPFCLPLYDALQVVRAHLASHQRCAAKALSDETLFYDVKRRMVAVNELVGWIRCVRCWAWCRRRSSRARLGEGLRGA